MSKLLLAPDSLFYKTPDGKYWSDTIYEYKFFERYLDVFEELVVVSRVKEVDYSSVKGFLRSDGSKIEIRELPAMRGMNEYIKNIIPFTKMARDACKNVDCALIRLPSVSASMVLYYFKKLDLPYSLEVVADPYDAYAINKLAQKFFTWHLKKECQIANGVSYVTQYYLQSKYPSNLEEKGNRKFFESYYSTINLSREYFYKTRNYNGQENYVIVHVANNMNNNVKGHEVLIRAFQKVVLDGFDVELKFVGNGSLRPYLENLVDKLDIRKRVTFVGMLSNSNDIRDELIKADLFVFPTKAEGLPRAIIEAMAVGLPCISTPVAGIPELLEQEDMIEPTNIDGFVQRIEEFISNSKLMNEKSSRNIEVAKNYRNDILQERRNEFYLKLKELSKKIK